MGDMTVTTRLVGSACVVLALIGAAGCSKPRSRAEPAKTAATVTAGSAVTVVDAAHHLTVSAGPDVVPPGNLVIAATAGNSTAVPVHDAASVVASGNGPIRGEIELRFRVPDGTPASATVAYFEESTRKWLPVPSTRTGNDLTGTTSHLTGFGWFDDTRLFLGQVVGNRAAQPECAAPPAWLHDLITTQGADAQVLACGEKSGTDLKVTVVNNRPYPVVLQLSAPPKSSAVDLSWPTSIRDFLARAAADAAGTGTTVALPPARHRHPDLRRATLPHDRDRPRAGQHRVSGPDRPHHRPPRLRLGRTGTLHRRKGPGTVHVGTSHVRRLRRGGHTESQRQQDRHGDPGVLRLRAGHPGRRTRHDPAQRWLRQTIHQTVLRPRRVQVLHPAARVEQLAEIGLDERPDVRDSVDLTLDLDPGPIAIGSDRVGPFTVGMTVEEVRAAAGVTLDHDEQCDYHTFHGEESFGEGDGPTFFFDDAGRLYGMLLGKSVFHRALRAEHNTRIRARLERTGYPACDHPPSPIRYPADTDKGAAR
jgi:hypothetical protein